ncbi:MAG: hypothetical protein ACRD8O_20395 [Bryobacteraceae bacterium]
MLQQSCKFANRIVNQPFSISRNCERYPSLKKRSFAALPERLRDVTTFFLKDAGRLTQDPGRSLTTSGCPPLIGRDIEDVSPGSVAHARQEIRDLVKVLRQLFYQNLDRAL